MQSLIFLVSHSFEKERVRLESGIVCVFRGRGGYITCNDTDVRDIYLHKKLVCCYLSKMSTTATATANIFRTAAEAVEQTKKRMEYAKTRTNTPKSDHMYAHAHASARATYDFGDIFVLRFVFSLSCWGWAHIVCAIDVAAANQCVSKYTRTKWSGRGGSRQSILQTNTKAWKRNGWKIWWATRFIDQITLPISMRVFSIYCVLSIFRFAERTFTDNVRTDRPTHSVHIHVACISRNSM